MKILVFDTSTQTMTIALQSGDDVFEFIGEGGSQASSRLIPEIQSLMARAKLDFKDLDCIAFGAGPGAFTGLRASCAVAQGLGFAAGVKLAPINTLHAVALQIHHKREPKQQGLREVTAAIDARMDEVYWQRFCFESELVGVPVDAQPQLSSADTLVDGKPFELGTWPTARTLLALAKDMLGKDQLVSPSDAQPIYVRNKVAQTTAEREALKSQTSA